MADIRLVNFPSKPNPAGADLTFIGDSVAGFREKKSTLDEVKSYLDSYESISLISITQDLDSTLLGKLIINTASVIIALPLGLVLPIGSQFRVFRGNAGLFTVKSLDPLVTINGAPSGIVDLVVQYDSALVTYTALNTYIVSYYSISTLPVERQIAYDNGTSALVSMSESRPWETYGFNRQVPIGGVLPNNPGSGYFGSPTTGDLIQTVGGVGTPAIFRVTIAGVGGVIEQLNLISPGDYSTFPGLTNVPTIKLTGAGDDLATVDLGSEPVSSHAIKEGSMQMRGPLTFGGPLLPVTVPVWADAQFLSRGGFGRGVWFQPRTPTEINYMQSLLPLNGLFFFNGQTNHFGTFIANQPHELAYTIDIPAPQDMQSTYDIGSSVLQEIGKPITVISEATALENTFTVDDGGSGYTVGDILSPSGGTAIDGLDAKIRVTSAPGGTIIAVGLFGSDTSPGRYSVSPPDASNLVTGGTGVGCHLDLTLKPASILTIDLNSQGGVSLQDDNGSIVLPILPVGSETLGTKSQGAINYHFVDKRIHLETDVKSKGLAFLDDIPVPEYAEMYFQGNAIETVITTKNIPVPIAGAYLSGSEFNGFIHIGDSLQCVDNTKVVQIIAVASGIFEFVTGQVSLSIFKNGVLVRKMPHFFGVASPARQNITCQALISVAPSDLISARIENNTDTDNPTITDLSVIIKK